MASKFQKSPIARKEISNIQKIEDIERLVLTQFSPTLKIIFENIIKNDVAKRNIILHNPSKKCMKVGFTKLPPVKRNLQLNWYHNVIPPEEEISLELTWSPLDCGCWRDIIVLVDNGRICKYIPVIFKSISAKTNEKKATSKHDVRKIKSPNTFPIKRVLKPQPFVQASPNNVTNTRKIVKFKTSSTTTVTPDILVNNLPINFPNNFLQTNEAIGAAVNLPVGQENNDNVITRNTFINSESTIVKNEVFEDSLELHPTFEVHSNNLINIKADKELLSKTPNKVGLINFPNNLLQTNEAIGAAVNLPVGQENNDNVVTRNTFINSESTIVKNEVFEDSLELHPTFEFHSNNLINIKADKELLSKTPNKVGLINYPNNLLQTNEAIGATVNLPVGPRNNNNIKYTIIKDEVFQDTQEPLPTFKSYFNNLTNNDDNELLSKTPIKVEISSSSCSTSQKSITPTLSPHTNLTYDLLNFDATIIKKESFDEDINNINSETYVKDLNWKTYIKEESTQIKEKKENNFMSQNM